MEKYFTTIEAFAVRHGHCFRVLDARAWLLALEKEPQQDRAGLYNSDKIHFSYLKDEFKNRWDITKEFFYVYETWKSLIEKHGYNPYAFTRESVTYKQDKNTLVKETELAKIKSILK